MAIKTHMWTQLLMAISISVLLQKVPDFEVKIQGRV